MAKKERYMKESNMNKTPNTSAQRSKRVFVIFSAIFLSAILLFGVIFGAVAIAKSNSAVMRYKGIYLTDGVSAYLATTYKYDLMTTLTKSGVECYDSPYFWQSESEEGRTWGDVLAEGAERYIKRVMIGSYLFDRNTRLNKSDKEVIDKAVCEVVEYRAGGSVDRFNELSEKMGFTYRDFTKAAELMYKYEMAEAVIFGYDGAALKGGGFSAECSEYFESAYSHVKLIIMRTDGEMVTDPETGKEVLSEYDDATRAKVEADIEHVRELIYNFENDLLAEQMSPEAFEWYVNKYKTGTVNDTEGYYFSSSSAYSLEFAEDAPEIVSLSLSTEVGHYAECELDIGVCFIYKCPLEENAYTRISLSHFFEDFYENASSYVYSTAVDAYLDAVTVSERYDAKAVVGKPYNYELCVKFG